MGFPQTFLICRVVEVKTPTKKTQGKMQHQLRRKMVLCVHYNLTNAYTKGLVLKCVPGFWHT